MTNPAAPLPIPALGGMFAEEEGGMRIASRFGEVRVDNAKLFTFPRGLLGFPAHANFALADFPNENMHQFKLLQSLDEHALSFIILPLALDNSTLARQDMLAAAAALGIAPGDLECGLIISVQRTPERVRITGNARAPIFMDKSRRLGAQYVFQDARYQVQSEIKA